MTKNTKKIWCTALAAAMLTSMALSGCNNNNNSSSGGSSSGGTSSSTSSKDDGGDNSGGGLYTEPGTYPIVNEEITLRLFMEQAANTIDYNTNDFTLLAEERTGINLEFETAPSDSLKEKVNLAFATQDLPDMFVAVNVDDARYGVEEGQLIDLTELIDTKMPEFQKILAEQPTMQGAVTATDGKIYQFPTFNECYHCTTSAKMWVNTEHLKTMGVSAPTTIDEFYEVCKKYKDQFPNGIPVAGGEGWHAYPTEFICNAYTYLGSNTWGLRLKDGAMETAVNTDEYREALKFLNKLYNEGLLYEATYSTTADQLKSILVEEGEPVLFFFQGASINLIDSASTPELYSHYAAVEPLTGPNGVNTTTHEPSTPTGYFSITTACKEPEAAARLVDYFYSEEGYYCMSIGMEGKDWVYDENNEWLGANGEPAKVIRLSPYSQEPQNRCWQDRIAYASAERRFSESSYKVGEEPDLYSTEGLETMLYQATHDLYQKHIPTEWQALPSLAFTVDENSSVQTIKVELQKLIEEGRVQFITGVQDINDDGAWNSYVSSIDSIGMPTLLEVYQSAYDRQYK